MSRLQDLLQSSLSGSYTVERELGGGGMSRVFVAEETALGRKVVVKVLSPELAEGLSAERFVREIKLAARLQQANIVPVLRAGDLGGLPYYTMPFVTGESLRAHMDATPMSTGEAIAILRDVAKALAYAHSEGVVHRDVKPENVLLSAGTAVVTDFGIAKALAAAKRGVNEPHDHPGDLALTSMGTSLGTPAYMAPEQAAGDPDTDERADIYAWGVMAYEMLGGRHPFAPYDNLHELLLAHMTEVPDHLAVRAPGVPRAVSDLVMRCLSKLPAERPASASELIGVLDATRVSHGGSAVTSLGVGRALAIYFAALIVVAFGVRIATTLVGLPQWAFGAAVGMMLLGLPVVVLTALTERQHRLAPPAKTPASTFARMAVRHPRRFTWRRTAKGGVGAFALLSALVAGYMTMRERGIGPFGTLIGAKALAARDRIVIADMRGPASDSALGAVLAEGMRAGLSESKAIRLVPSERLTTALQQMKRPGAAVSGSVAREVAERAGAKAILDGDVRRVGAAYVLSVQLLSARGGEPLVALQETATSDRDFTRAAGTLANRLRERVGESLKSVNSAPALASVTTSSLPALRKYTEALRASRAGDYFGAMRLGQEAVAIDSGFVSAYMLIGSQISGISGMRHVQSELLARAFANRARATEFERALVEVNYWRSGPTLDFRRANAAAEAALAIDPDAAAGPAGSAALLVRDYARAIRYLQTALAVDSSDVGVHYELAVAYAELGHLDSAAMVIRDLRARSPQHPIGLVVEAELASLKGDDSTSRRMAVAMEQVKAYPVVMEWGALMQMAVSRRAGRFRESYAARLRAEHLRAARGVTGEGSLTALMMVDDRATLLGDTAGAKRLLDSARHLAAAPIESAPPRSRSWIDLATAAIAAGRIDIARQALAAQQADDPTAVGPFSVPVVPLIEGTIARGERRFDDAVAAFRRADVSMVPRLVAVELALTFDAAGRKDSALVYYEKFVNSTSLDLILWIEGTYLARARKRLGELYDERGDVDKAIAQYSAFVNQWRQADSELQPVVQAFAARVKLLERKRAR